MPGFHHSVVVLPFPLAISDFPYTVAVAACLGSSATMIGWPATERNNGKIELDPISAVERLRQLFAVYGCNGTEFSYIIFTEQRNFTMAEQRNGNGRTATEWWKPGISQQNKNMLPHLTELFCGSGFRQTYRDIWRDNTDDVFKY